MTGQKMPWFRWYSETVRDVKLRRLPVAHRWLWAAVLTAASDSPHRGVLLLSDDVPLEESDLADLAALPVAQVRKGMASLVELGMVGFDERSGAWFVPRFADRQPASDSSTDRVRAFRQRKRNADETLQGRSEPVTGNAPEVETELELDPLEVSATSSNAPPDPAETDQANLTISAAAARLGRADHDRAKADGVAILSHKAFRAECVARRTAEAQAAWRPGMTADDLCQLLATPTAERTTPTAESPVLAVLGPSTVEPDPGERTDPDAAKARIAELRAASRTTEASDA